MAGRWWMRTSRPAYMKQKSARSNPHLRSDRLHAKGNNGSRNIAWPEPVIYTTLRENRNFPSVKGFPESQKSSPSVALGEELHSEKRGFPECRSLPGTRGRMTLEKSPLPRAQHSGKRRTRGRKMFLDVPNKRRRWTLKWKKFFPERKKNSRGRRPFPSAKAWHSGKMLPSPSAAVLALGEEALPESQERHSGKFFFLVFFCPNFFDVFPYYFKLLVQIWWYLNFFKYISFVFFVSLIFFCKLHIWTAGALNNRISLFKKWYSWYLVYFKTISTSSMKYETSNSRNIRNNLQKKCF